jgi:uncharacterized iron-regulated membrane protein
MRLLRRVHAWAGLVLALLVAAVAASGTLLVFEADYLRAEFPAARAAPPVDARSLGGIVDAIGQQFGREARSVVFGTAEMGLHQVYLHDGGGAYIDAAGRVVDHWSAGGRPELWLFELHENLLAGETGHLVAGTAGLAAAVMAVTGLVLWWPGARAFRGRLWPRSLQRPALVAHHRDLGVIAAVPVLLLALTGAALVFDEQARTVLGWVLPAAPEPDPPAPIDVAAPLAPLPLPDGLALLAAAQARFPEAALRIVSFADERGTITVRLKQEAEWHPNGRTRVTLSAATGAVLDSYDAVRQPLAARAYAALYPLHAARIGGRAYDLLLAASGLALTLLAGLGAVSFARLQLRRRSAAESPGAVPLPERRT